MMWMIAGLALGAALAFLLEQLDRGFHSSKQTEELLGVPVLASVPKADKEVETGLRGEAPLPISTSSIP